MNVRLSTSAIAVILIAATGCSDQLSQDQVDALSRAVESSFVRVQNMNSVMIEALEGRTAQPSDRVACPDGVQRDTDQSGDNYGELDADQLPGAIGPRLVDVTQQVEVLRSRVSRSGPNPMGDGADAVGSPFTGTAYPHALDWAERLSDSLRWRYDVVFLPTERVDPQAINATSFRGGVIRGRAVVWDYESEAVVCEADIEVTLRDIENVFDSSASESDQLRRTLEYHVRETVFERLGLSPH